MSKQPQRRLKTGNRRRLPVRRTSHNRRYMALSHQQVGYMIMVQKQLRGNLIKSLASLAPLYMSICAYFIAKKNLELFPVFVGHTEIIFRGLLCMNVSNFFYHLNKFISCYRLDYLLHDITPEEEAMHVGFTQRKNIDFECWSDQECYQNTGFNKCKLERIFKCFGLQTNADQIDGYIRVYNGSVNSDGRACCYLFDPEEMFLYFMTRMKKGLSHTDMCNLIFGGSSKRWSPGWRWMLMYLDHRYGNIIGHQGLTRFLDDFPRFYNAIQQKVMQDYICHNHDGTMTEIQGLNFLPFEIFGFIDCSIDKICRPFSGPDGDYVGAPQKEQYDGAQRAFTPVIKNAMVSRLKQSCYLMESAHYLVQSLLVFMIQQVC
jgi:hypothetical protein